MNRFPAKVKGSRLDSEERRHRHRGARDPPTPHCCLGVSTGTRTHISPSAGAGGHSPRDPLTAPVPHCHRLPDIQGEGPAHPPSQPPHRSLTISFLELFIRMWSCSLVTMMPSVSSASFTMNLQGEGKSLRPSNQPLPPLGLWGKELAASLCVGQRLPLVTGKPGLRSPSPHLCSYLGSPLAPGRVNWECTPPNCLFKHRPLFYTYTYTCADTHRNPHTHSHPHMHFTTSVSASVKHKCLPSPAVRIELKDDTWKHLAQPLPHSIHTHFPLFFFTNT